METNRKAIGGRGTNTLPCAEREQQKEGENLSQRGIK